MSSNALLVDRLTRAQLLLQRHSNAVVRELTPILDRLRKDIERRLMETPTEFQQARLGTLYNDLTAIITEITGQLEIELVDAIEPLAEYQAGLAARALQASVAVEVVKPSIEQIAAVVTRSRMRLVSGKQIKSLTLNQLITEYAGGVDRQIKTAIQAGVIEGKTVQQITSEVMPQVAARSRRQAETLVRTAVNHVGSVARQRTYEANADVLAGERYVSVMDSHVTQTCAGFADQVFPIGQGPMPPQHYGCRSVRVPEVKDEFKIPGLEGERATVKGPVSARKTFDGWLRDQPAEFQKEYFFKFDNGEERYKLFREGVKLRQFTDDAGVVIPLEQLKAMEGLVMA